MRKPFQFSSLAVVGSVTLCGIVFSASSASAFDDGICAKVETTTQKALLDIRANETIDFARARGIDKVSEQAVYQVVGYDIESSRAGETRAIDETATSSYQEGARSSYKGLVRVRLIDVSRIGFDEHQQLELTADVSVCVPKPETVLALEHEKAERDKQPPRPVDPEKVNWFDPSTGEARLWYWAGPNQDYTFFDKGGFDPTTGDPLRRVDRQFSKDWRVLIAKRRKDVAELMVAQQKEAVRKQAEEVAARQLSEQRAEQATRALASCDVNAANPNDPRKPSTVIGVSWDALKATAVIATQSCELAVRQMPGEPRYRYELARAYSANDPKRSLPMFKQLCDERYPAACDNYGWSLLDSRVGLNDLTGATRAFEVGIRAGDSDAMTSLAGLMARGSVDPNFPDEPIQLYRRAAKMGNQDAIVAVARLEAEQAQGNALRAQQDEQARQQEQTGRMFMGIVGGALANVGRR